MNDIKIIAEIGANHNGDMTLAKEMISAAKESGCDFAKFQSWKESNLRKGVWDSPEPFFQYENKRDFYKKAQLTDDNHYELIEYCNKVDINFLTTCFDRERVEFLAGLPFNTIKIASTDSISDNLIVDLADYFGQLIVSTGMTYTKEIEHLIQLLDRIGLPHVVMYCSSIYPSPAEKNSIHKMRWIKERVSGEFGISDHSLGNTAAKIGVCNGATWIEKHFTTDREIPGPDNHMSATPSEIKDLRKFCDEYVLMDKNKELEPLAEEIEVRDLVYRRFGYNR